MNRIIVFLSLWTVVGCLTASDPEVAFWPVEYCGETKAADAAKYNVARMSAVTIRAPFGENRLAVLRENGSIAFDNKNEYAASPAMLAKGIVGDAMRASGLFKTVIGSSSAVSADVSVEVVVTRLALDCRKEGMREAEVNVKVRLAKDGQLLAAATGEGRADAANGRYGEAFSKAISSALDNAFASLK